MKRRRILICGSRHWTAWKPIERRLAALPKSAIIIHGACGKADAKDRPYQGADLIAGYIANRLGLEVREYPALWDVHGRAAGPIRNRLMLTHGKPHEVWAFHNDIANSRGTGHMVKIARAAGKPVTVVKLKRRSS